MKPYVLGAIIAIPMSMAILIMTRPHLLVAPLLSFSLFVFFSALFEYLERIADK
jgi:hypothetical protein